MAEKILARAQSEKRARKLLDSFIDAGGYKAVGLQGDYILYRRVKDGVTEELTIKKVSDRDYSIVKLVD